MAGGRAEKVNVLHHSSLQSRWDFCFLVFCFVIYEDLIESTDYLGFFVYGFQFLGIRSLETFVLMVARVSHVLFLLFLFIFKIL